VSIGILGFGRECVSIGILGFGRECVSIKSHGNHTPRVTALVVVMRLSQKPKA